MWKVKDMVVGEIIETKSRQTAIKITKERIAKHNTEYCYLHCRGKHYNAHANYTIDEANKEILIKGG